MSNPNKTHTSKTHDPKSRSETPFAILLASIVAIMPFSIDAYLPAMPTIAASLQTDIHHVEMTLGLFLLGAALAQLFAGFFSDTKGRRLTVLIGLSVYIVASLGLTLSTNIDMFKAFRVCQAIGAGFSTVVVAASVRDRFSGNEAARIFALIGVIMMGAPLLAPIIGAAILTITSWQGIFWFLSAYGLCVFIAVFIFFRFEKPKQQRKDKHVALWRQVAHNYGTVLKTRRALGYLFFQVASLASMFTFLTEASFVYIELYGASESLFSLLFACNIITMVIFNRITAFKLKITSPQSILLVGVVIQISINFLLLIIAQFGQPPLWLLVSMIMLSVGSQGFISANTTACYMDYFKENSGSATAVSGTTGSLIAALFGLITVKLHDGATIIPMATMMFVSTLIGVCLLFWFSPDMREVTRNIIRNRFGQIQ